MALKTAWQNLGREVNDFDDNFLTLEQAHKGKEEEGKF